jgi:hypothetical protein
MTIDDIKGKLGTLDLPKSEINEITSIDVARGVARKLFDTAN